MRRKIRVNVRELFIAHHAVKCEKDIKILVNTGYRDLHFLRLLAAQDDQFFASIGRKS